MYAIGNLLFVSIYTGQEGKQGEFFFTAFPVKKKQPEGCSFISSSCIG